MFTIPKLKISLDASGLQRVSHSILNLAEPARRFEIVAEQEVCSQLGIEKYPGQTTALSER